jgi:hypothetical protein
MPGKSETGGRRSEIRPQRGINRELREWPRQRKNGAGDVGSVLRIVREQLGIAVNLADIVEKSCEDSKTMELAQRCFSRKDKLRLVLTV